MKSRDQLIYLLEEYYKGNYETVTFTNEFNRIYDLETDYLLLSEKEHKLFKELSEVTSRFSQFKEDLSIPNAFFDEEAVKEKVKEIYCRLKKGQNDKS